MKPKKVLSIIIALVLSFSLTACKIPVGLISIANELLSDAEIADIFNGNSEYEPIASDGIGADVPSKLIPEYKHMEKEDAFLVFDAFVEAGNKGDKEAIESLYQQSCDIVLEFSEMNTVAYIHYCQDVTDEYYDEEYKYSELCAVEVSDKFYSSVRKVLESDGSKYLMDIIDEYIYEDSVDYEDMTERELLIEEELTKLQSDYEDIFADFDSITYDYKGETYSFSELFDEDSKLIKLAYSDYTGLMTVYSGLLETVNKQAGDIYLQIIKLNDEKAKINGYDNFSDFAYECLYGRDYTPKEAQIFCDAVKNNISGRYYNEISNSARVLYSSTVPMSYEQLLDSFSLIAEAIDPMVADTYDFFLTNELYSIGNEDCRFEGSFTTSLNKSKIPYIFMKLEPDSGTISSIAHEFGHYCDMYYEMNHNSIFAPGNLDVMEMHSNGLELITINFIDRILDENILENYGRKEIASGISQVVDGCLYDEFQRRVYENTDLTLDDINEIYAELLDEYHYDGLPGDEYLWVEIPHTFESPLYYLSYAVSEISALELFAISLEDTDKAIETWKKLVYIPDDETYEETLKQTGLSMFYDSDRVIDICTAAMDYVALQ